MITFAICGSMAFYKEMAELASKLKVLGHTIFLPEEEETVIDRKIIGDDAYALKKKKFIDAHLEKIRKSDAVIIANYDKRHIAGYIGANTLIEMAFAYALGKTIYVLKSPGEQSCQDEVLGMSPKIFNELV